jgi:hypothetical protein
VHVKTGVANGPLQQLVLATAGASRCSCTRSLHVSLSTLPLFPSTPPYTRRGTARSGYGKLNSANQNSAGTISIFPAFSLSFTPLFLVQSGTIVLLGLISPIHSCRLERLRSRTQICSFEIETHAFMCYARNMRHTCRQKSHLFLTVYVLVVCNAGTTSIQRRANGCGSRQRCLVGLSSLGLVSDCQRETQRETCLWLASLRLICVCAVSCCVHAREGKGGRMRDTENRKRPCVDWERICVSVSISFM